MYYNMAYKGILIKWSDNIRIQRI